MPSFVIACYRPKAGQEADLLNVVEEHLPILRSQGLVTDRPPYVMRANDGTIVEVFEWKSQEAVRQAHENPVVRELWDRFDACCDCISLRDLKETEGQFADFEPIDL